MEDEKDAKEQQKKGNKKKMRDQLITPLTAKVGNPNKKFQCLCRYELVSPGNCRRGKERWFSHDIRSREKDEMNDIQWQGQWQGSRETV